MTARSKPGRGPGAAPVIVAALGGFLIVLAILGGQMRAGNDPAVKPAAASPAPRRIVERRVVVRRVIITDAPAAGSGPAASRGAAAAVPAAPSTVRSAPVQVVQAPPPPAAPVTRTS